jgi:hypothetical protein
MAKVTIRRGDAEFEINDLTFEQVKELVGVNGHGHNAPSAAAPQLLPLRDDFAGFLKVISNRARLFINTLRHNPSGIEANALAAKLSFNDARQLGGLTGAGVARMAKKHGVRVKDIYRTDITSPSGKRTVTFYPGKLVLALNEEKPAV